MNNFSDLQLSAYVAERLSRASFSVPTPVQAAAIPKALAGNDLMATAPTGTGKTLAFLIPVIEKLLRAPTPGISALVLLPTRELATQVAEQFDLLRGKQLGPAALVVGGFSEGPQLKTLRSGARVVIATPGRLEDYLQRGLVRFNALSILVLDEVDRMLDMGFLPALRRIAAVLPRARQTLCFSATLEGSVAHLVHDYTKHPVRLAFGSTQKPAENVRLQAFEASNNSKMDVLHRLLREEAGRCLIFARTKRGAERISWGLARRGIRAATMHGDRSQSQRTAALEGFQNGRYRVLVATDLASRGIHVEEIAHVINYDLPDVAENFIHRVGRTGRAGHSGLASTLFSPDQRTELAQLERTLGIRMARISAGAGEPARDSAPLASLDAPMPAAVSGRMLRLPGEFLQAQMEI